MGKNVNIALVLAALSVMVLVGFYGIENTDGNSYSTAMLGVSRTIVIDTEIPEAPPTLPYYRVLGEEYVNERFGSTSLPREHLPSENDAIEFAKEYLSLHGGMPDGAVLSFTDVETIQKCREGSGEVIYEKPVLVRVVYGRSINGMPVDGPGDTIDFSIGDNGEILDLLMSWRILEEVGEIAIVGSDVAIARLRKGETVRKLMGPFGKFSVQSINLGYYSNTPGTEQEFYKPIWIFRGIDEDGWGMHMAVRATDP
ncbi:MAG: hypothetical protein U9N46_11520 [Euryarchaeota archaeon]|nr:hypothetical protein [Euryarchaeota archaeon]